jgi:hypothetical protein
MVTASAYSVHSNKMFCNIHRNFKKYQIPQIHNNSDDNQSQRKDNKKEH